MTRKIIAIANPPYHEMDGGHRVSARPIYHLFIEKLMDFKIEEFLFLIPGKWFVKGKGLTKFRQRIKDCGKIKAIKHFPKANQVALKHNKKLNGSKVICKQILQGICLEYEKLPNI
jgi:hypothetical protein